MTLKQTNEAYLTGWIDVDFSHGHHEVREIAQELIDELAGGRQGRLVRELAAVPSGDGRAVAKYALSGVALPAHDAFARVCDFFDATAEARLTDSMGARMSLNFHGPNYDRVIKTDSSREVVELADVYAGDVARVTARWSTDPTLALDERGEGR